MLMTGFFCTLALAESFVTQFSSLDAFLIWSMSIGRRGGRLFTASDSILMRKAPTTMFEKGCRHFRLKCRIFFRRVTIQGGGFIAKRRSSTTSFGWFSTLKMTGRILSRCGRSEHSPDPEEGNGDGIESLPPSEVTAKKELIEIIHLEMRSSN
jgi:hypothetical protein